MTMLIVTTEHIAGHRVTATLGQVFGVVVRRRGIGGNIVGGLRSIVGGGIHEYTQLLEEARRHAIDRAIAGWWALALGGVIVVGVLAERVIYKPLAQNAPPGWQRTGERFVDDATGKVVEVFYDPKSGERQYVQRG
jgi:uncharacterized protein YbjQ (UPF0145 family)